MGLSKKAKLNSPASASQPATQAPASNATLPTEMEIDTIGPESTLSIEMEVDAENLPPMGPGCVAPLSSSISPASSSSSSSSSSSGNTSMCFDKDSSGDYGYLGEEDVKKAAANVKKVYAQAQAMATRETDPLMIRDIYAQAAAQVADELKLLEMMSECVMEMDPVLATQKLPVCDSCESAGFHAGPYCPHRTPAAAPASQKSTVTTVTTTTTTTTTSVDNTATGETTPRPGEDGTQRPSTPFPHADAAAAAAQANHAAFNHQHDLPGVHLRNMWRQ